MEAAIRQHAADLDRQLGTAPPPPLQPSPPSTEGYADAYARKMTQFEVPTSHDSRTHTVATLLGALADPYVLILVVYVAAVALQLVWLTRSALQGKLANALHKPTRVRVLLAAALLSLLATWYNMFAYLVWSYNAFLERTALTGQELTSMPLCSIQAHRQGVRCALAKSTAHTMRVSAWLRQTILFQEAWLSVVRGRHNWWWSVEVCLFTVGVWALYVRTQGKRFGVRHTWAYMVIGQTCAISVAQNLFAVALAVRALQPKKSTRRSSSVRSDAELMPPPSSRVSKRSLAAAAAASEIDGVSGLLLNAALAAAGLAFVFMIPDTMLKLASMHLAPMLIVLPLVDTSARQLNAYIRPSLLYGLVAWLSFTIRMRTHSAVLASSDRLLPTMFSQPAQTSISADAVCITLSVMLQLYLYLADGVLSFAEGWALLVLTPLVGPSTTFASALALVESRREEAIDGVADIDDDAATAKQQDANASSTSAKSTPRKSQGSTKTSSRSSDTPSGKATSSSRKSGSFSRKASRISSSHSAATSADESSNDSKARRSSSGSRSTRAKATTEEATSSSTRSKPRKSKAAAAASETDGEASSASARGQPPLADTPAGRAKRTRARPRKMDAVDGEQLVASEAEIGGSAPSRRRRGSSSARRSVRS